MAILRAGPWWSGNQALDAGPSTWGDDGPDGAPVNCADKDWLNQSWEGRSDYDLFNSSTGTNEIGGKTFSLDQYVETGTDGFAFLAFNFYWQATNDFDIKQTVETFADSGFGDWSVILSTIEDGEVFNYFNTIGGGGTQTETFTLPATTLGFASFFMAEQSGQGEDDAKIKSKLESA